MFGRAQLNRRLSLGLRTEKTDISDDTTDFDVAMPVRTSTGTPVVMIEVFVVWAMITSFNILS
jgi:hypothetical protein